VHHNLDFMIFVWFGVVLKLIKSLNLNSPFSLFLAKPKPAGLSLSFPHSGRIPSHGPITLPAQLLSPSLSCSHRQLDPACQRHPQSSAPILLRSCTRPATSPCPLTLLPLQFSPSIRSGAPASTFPFTLSFVSTSIKASPWFQSRRNAHWLPIPLPEPLPLPSPFLKTWARA
jgi:hypothetical protein